MQKQTKTTQRAHSSILIYASYKINNKAIPIYVYSQTMYLVERIEIHEQNARKGKFRLFKHI